MAITHAFWRSDYFQLNSSAKTLSVVCHFDLQIPLATHDRPAGPDR